MQNLTNEEKKQLVDAVITRLKNDGTDVSNANIVSNADGIDYVVAYDNKGQIVRAVPAAINSVSTEVIEGIESNAIAGDSLTFSNTKKDLSIEFETLDGNTIGAVILPAATTEKAGVMTAADKKKLDSLSPGGGGGGGVAELMVEVTYSELVALRDNASLVAGMKYRITDYVTTTVQKDTKSANHPFDVIVEAVSENELSELAQAIQHEGDTYFDGNDLGAWQLWYSLDNDTTKYDWADAKNGKGVIYRMIDEKRNDCPYDFKNILFYTANYTDNIPYDNYYYTFSYVVNGVLYDGTIEKRVTSCYNNSIGVYTSSGRSGLNGNIFRNTLFERRCSSNTFGDNCSNNTFGSNCYNNRFLDSCYNNRFLDNCYSNTFGDNCYNNTFGNFNAYNTFEDYCYGNEFWDGCRFNIFKGDCYGNIFSSNCKSNIFSNNCCSNKFSDMCSFNTFSNNCSDNKFSDNCESNKFNDGCIYNTFGIGCTSNIFGIGCTSNKFGDICKYNIFENNCSENIFREGCRLNAFGNECQSNIFDNNTSNRKLDENRTSITLNEEYYDDGNNALVPIKHPDLSTQPSILPYKFMGQYVYEQLIPVNNASTVPISILAVDNPVILECFYVGIKYVAPCEVNVMMLGEVNYIKIEVKSSDAPSGNGLYYKIVYTSMPKEGDYYGYNNY